MGLERVRYHLMALPMAFHFAQRAAHAWGVELSEVCVTYHDGRGEVRGPGGRTAAFEVAATSAQTEQRHGRTIIEALRAYAQSYGVSASVSVIATALSELAPLDESDAVRIAAGVALQAAQELGGDGGRTG